MTQPTQQYHTVQPPPQDDHTVVLIAALLAGSASAGALAAGIRHLVPGASQDAVEGGLRIIAHATVPTPRLRKHLKGQATQELYYRAAYLVKAIRRIDAHLAEGEPLRVALSQENTFYRQHESARRGRIKALRDVETAAASFGPLLGWYLNPLLNNEIECIKANGHNFIASEGTVIGLPGAVHLNCGCQAGPPIEGAGMVNDAVAGILRTPGKRRVRLKVA